MNLISSRLGLSVLAIGLLSALPIFAQDYPNKPIKIIAPFPLGTGPDANTREIAQELTKVLGQSVVVENRPGASTMIGMEVGAKATPDGYTLVTINPSAYPELRWKQTDFKPIAKGIESPLLLVVHPSVPARTLPELASWLIANPAKGAYASFSPGTPSHFLGFQLNERLKLNMVHVPYKGSAPQLNDLIGGQVLLGFTQMQGAMQQVQAGKLHAIAITSLERSRFLPQVPTLAELGHRDLSLQVWFGLVAPVATPPKVIEVITAAVVKAQGDTTYRTKLEAQGFEVPRESGSAFETTILNDTARWARVVQATGFKAND
jgi:tripartite-type tricarboxylate transporter receptor subunit TctC